MNKHPFVIPVLVGILSSLPAVAQEMERPPLPEIGATLPTDQVIAHDPVLIQQGDTYYVFTTGPGIPVWSSKDLHTWTRQNSVFDPYPAWVPVEIPKFEGHLWAPDISYHDGLYYLFYSASVGGKNTSAIGLATNKTLDRDSPDFQWIDHGKIIESYPGTTDWNAIDPNVAEDTEGNAYLTFGSFWSGIQMVKLMPDRMSLDGCWKNLETIASRRKMPESGQKTLGISKEAGPNAIEAPFIFHHGDYYYLFASTDYCCRGPRSNYKVIVGRSSEIQGPYVDKEGLPLRFGGGTLLLQGDSHFYGVGHNAAVRLDGKDYIVYHGYDKTNGTGWPKLVIREMTWDDEGWPVVADE